VFFEESVKKMSEKLLVLLIEAGSSDNKLIRELLGESKNLSFDLLFAENLSEGLKYLDQRFFDVILLDLALPDSSGLDTLLAVRRFRPDIAVIVLTGLDDEDIGLQATQAGAQDYLVKGRVSSWLLIRSIRYAIERKRFESRLEYLATHDDLTGLPNRQMFNYTLSQALERARREKHISHKTPFVAVMLLDLDNYKEVNDQYGHMQGDKLLSSVARRLQNCVRKSDTVARMGGDEFTLVIENIAYSKDSEITARKILTSLAEPIQIGGGIEVVSSASIGISIYPSDGDNPESLLQFADIAMYQAKKSGNSFKFYSDHAV